MGDACVISILQVLGRVPGHRDETGVDQQKNLHVHYGGYLRGGGIQHAKVNLTITNLYVNVSVVVIVVVVTFRHKPNNTNNTNIS